MIKRENQFEELRHLLGTLATASAASAKFWKQGRGRPRNDPPSLVLMDIIAIYEWLTDKKATREVGRDTGKDTGLFWEFAKTIWPLVFDRGERGLSAAIQRWAGARKKKLKGARSASLRNIDMHHPDWGISTNKPLLVPM